MSRKFDWKVIVFFLFIALSFTGCFDPEEGCLDANARNYAIDADRACTDNCCEYPELQIDFQHKVFVGGASQNINFGDSVYVDGGGNPFSLVNLQYYLSNIHLVRSDGSTVGILDSVSFETASNEPLTVEDNIILVNPEDFGSQIIGSFNGSSDYVGIRFNIGLTESFNQADTLDFTSDHPLAPQENNMYLGAEEGYIFNRIELLTNPSVDTINKVLEISGTESLVTLEFPANFFLDKGFNMKLVLLVDYLNWFNQLDLIADEEEVIKQTIVNNLANSFSLVEIEFN